MQMRHGPVDCEYANDFIKQGVGRGFGDGVKTYHAEAYQLRHDKLLNVLKRHVKTCLKQLINIIGFVQYC